MRTIDFRILELASPYLKTRKNDIHTNLSSRFALRLLESEPGDHAVVIPAIICHDVGWSKLTEDLQMKAFGPTFDPALNRIHEEQGVIIAREILSQVGYEPLKTAEILDIIDGHDSRLSAISKSDMLVKDADKLWRFGTVGTQIDVQRFNVEMNWYLTYLNEKIEDWFFTETAKRLAIEELAKTVSLNEIKPSSGGVHAQEKIRS